MVIPGIPFNVNGQSISFSYLWSSGIGIYVGILGTAMPISGWLMLKRKASSRLEYLSVLSLGLIAPYIYMQETELMFFGILFIVSIATYLYGNSTVRAYFASIQPLKNDDGKSGAF